MALTKDRNTPMMAEGAKVLVLPAGAGKKIYAGALVAVNAGYAEPASTATGLIAAGRAEESVDNTNGAAGAVSVRVRRGVFKYKNKSDDAVTQAEVLTDCYIVDDETVAKTNGTNTRSKAGRVIAVDSDGVWVEVV
jgi:hypothetical protein